MGRSWSGDSFKRKGGVWCWVIMVLDRSPQWLITYCLQVVIYRKYLSFLMYKCMFINVPYSTNRSHCARTGCYICISTPHGAPICTTYIGQIVVGCIQYTMPHRSGLESYVNTNKNHFVFHSI